MVIDVIHARREVNAIRAIDAFTRAFELEWLEIVAKLNDHRAELLVRARRGSLEHNVHFKPLLEEVLKELPKAEHERATEMVGDVLAAGTKANTVRAIDAVTCEFEPEWPEAAAKAHRGNAGSSCIF
jgi:hypothetical protein